MTAPIFGLTLWRPWGWAIFHLGKDVENRGLSFQAPAVGSWLAIHNGKHYDEDAALDLALSHMRELIARGLQVPEDEEEPSGCIIGVARVQAVTRAQPFRESRWYTGETGLWLTNTTLLPEPVPCRGERGLWGLPPAVLELVRTGWARQHPKQERQEGNTRQR